MLRPLPHCCGHSGQALLHFIALQLQLQLLLLVLALGMRQAHFITADAGSLLVLSERWLRLR